MCLTSCAGLTCLSNVAIDIFDHDQVPVWRWNFEEVMKKDEDLELFPCPCQWHWLVRLEIAHACPICFCSGNENKLLLKYIEKISLLITWPVHEVQCKLARNLKAALSSRRSLWHGVWTWHENNFKRMFFMMMWLHTGSNAEKMHQMSRWYVDKTMVPCRRWYPGDLKQHWHKQSWRRENEVAHCVETTAGRRCCRHCRKAMCACDQYTFSNGHCAT